MIFGRAPARSLFRLRVCDDGAEQETAPINRNKRTRNFSIRCAEYGRPNQKRKPKNQCFSLRLCTFAPYALVKKPRLQREVVKSQRTILSIPLERLAKGIFL